MSHHAYPKSALIHTAGHIEVLFSLQKSELLHNELTIYCYPERINSLTPILASLGCSYSSIKPLIGPVRKANFWRQCLYHGLLLPISYVNSPFTKYLGKKLVFYPDSIYPSDIVNLTESKLRLLKRSKLLYFNGTGICGLDDNNIHYISNEPAINSLKQCISSFSATNEIWILGKDMLEEEVYTQVFDYISHQYKSNENITYFPHPRESTNFIGKTNTNIKLCTDYPLSLSSRPKLIISMGTSMSNLYFNIVPICLIKNHQSAIKKRGYVRNDISYNTCLSIIS